MSNTDATKITAAQFNAQFTALQEVSAKTVDPCLAAKVIAGLDSRVRELFFQKVAAGFVFRGISCIDRFGVPENKYVLFDFDCIPGAFCLVPPAFMVVVNIIDRYVVAVVDPYLPTTIARKASDDCDCGGATRSLFNGCDDDVTATVEDGKVVVNILGFDIKFDVDVSVIANGTSVRVNLHRCGANCTKGARAELYVNDSRVACYKLAGDCDC